MKPEPSHETDPEVPLKIDRIYSESNTYYYVHWQDGPNGEKYKSTVEPKTIASIEEIQRWEAKKAEMERWSAEVRRRQEGIPQPLSPDPTARRRLNEQRIKEAAEASARAKSSSSAPLKVEIKAKEEAASQIATPLSPTTLSDLPHHGDTVKTEPSSDTHTNSIIVTPEVLPTALIEFERVSPSIQSSNSVKVEEDREIIFVADVKKDPSMPQSSTSVYGQARKVHTVDSPSTTLEDDTDVQITHVLPVKKDYDHSEDQSALASNAERTHSITPRPDLIKVEVDKAALQLQIQKMKAALQGAKRKLRDMEDE